MAEDLLRERSRAFDGASPDRSEKRFQKQIQALEQRLARKHEVLSELMEEHIHAFFHDYPLEGYRRLAFMMLDRDIVAVSPSSVYRVLKAAGLLADRWQKPSRKGLGFVQPLA